MGLEMEERSLALPRSQMLCIWTLVCQTGHIHARLFLLLRAWSTRFIGCS